MSTAFWTRRIRDKSVVLVDEKGNPIRPKTAETAAPVPAKPRAAKPSTNKDD